MSKVSAALKVIDYPHVMTVDDCKIIQEAGAEMAILLLRCKPWIEEQLASTNEYLNLAKAGIPYKKSIITVPERSIKDAEMRLAELSSILAEIDEATKNNEFRDENSEELLQKYGFCLQEDEIDTFTKESEI